MATIEEIEARRAKEEEAQKELDRIRKEKCDRVEAILSSIGAELIINGCGCCGSPIVSFKHNGEVILDDESDVCIPFPTD